MRNFRRVAASLLVLLLAFSASADWSKARKDFEGAKNHDAAVESIEKNLEKEDQDLQELIADYRSASNKEVKDSTFQSIQDLINANASSENFSPMTGAEAKARAIKDKNPLYKTERESNKSTWLQKLFERLKNIFSGQNNDRNTNYNPPNVPEWIPSLLRGIFYLLIVAIIGGLCYLLTKIPWGSIGAFGKSKKKARGGMLEEGEELLSEDEYMKEADRLIAEGRYREACRALYLASLLRLDATRVARFEPTQTNWEHLRRIETSKYLPGGLDFRTATKAYDHAWYGSTARSIADVAIFQTTYLEIKRLTEEAK